MSKAKTDQERYVATVVSVETTDATNDILRVTRKDGTVEFVPTDPENSDYARLSQEYDV